ncbi:MAG TPA: DUF3006 domain-containing protein, partial [Methanotrichaceae archaeon]|nr:DUF3006 domain-containing protein [Methanotrichaceae archaeon]
HTSVYRIQRGGTVKLWMLIICLAALWPVCGTSSNTISTATDTLEGPSMSGIYSPGSHNFERGTIPNISDGVKQELLSLHPSSGARLINNGPNTSSQNAYFGGYMKATLDRIEGSIAVLLIRDDERIRINIPISLLPEDSKEGDILDITIQRDENATDQARTRTSELIAKLKRKSSSTR